ncbi:MAG: ATP phosphoribosyltransferase regulatory subunit, partial [Bacteroidales bacterium]|nr:ATP phosphoribosyltransferase regulatory subunit [Bacteroidales bacterium]
ILFLEGDTNTKLLKLEEILKDSETGIEGVREMYTLFRYMDLTPLDSVVELDLTLARGLNYYTGAIIEVKALDYEIGSICGGGRYDDLAGVFGMAGISGVGVSFGADRIYDVLDKLDLFPDRGGNETRILFVNFGGDEEMYAIRMLGELRRAGISAELYPDPVKLKKQMTFANSRNIPYVAIAGEDEINKKMVTVKNMDTGTQSVISSSDLISLLIPG